MRNGQNKRMRSRNNRKGQNPMTRVYESNGPDVKIRGTAAHVAEKYVQLARDAQGSGDPVGAENYYQHAEHYFRIIAAAQEQFRQNQPYVRNDDMRDDGGDDAEGEQFSGYGAEPGLPGREPQPYPQREQQPFQGREPREHREPRESREPREPRDQPSYRQQQQQPRDDSDIDRLPSFITGGAPQPQGGDEHPRGERYPHRRRRRHHGPRGDVGAAQPSGDDFSAGTQSNGD
ncbi:MAG: DUF4167 domain-containing protein [Xanthobacteraceae bacterium]|nr:MAG: DUF4167 domain-containing protein [Xanthobacteraceae bacterium]